MRAHCKPYELRDIDPKCDYNILIEDVGHITNISIKQHRQGARSKTNAETN